jgi:hypothetical protein
LADFADRHRTLIENCIYEGRFAIARKHIDQIRGRMERDTETPTAQKVEWQENLVRVENCCLALQTMESIMPKKKFSSNQLNESAALLVKVDPARPALFRQRVDAVESAASATQALGLMDG